MNEVCMRLLEGNMDIVGIAETKFGYENAMCCSFVSPECTKLIMASSGRSYGSTYRPGGTLLLSRGSITGQVVGSGTDDMGRWCWTTYNGSANRKMMVITAYQVCAGTPVHDVTLHRVTKKYSAGTQQYSMMIKRGHPMLRTLQTQFKMDLKTLLEGFLIMRFCSWVISMRTWRPAVQLWG
jgi:hypothetical protein